MKKAGGVFGFLSGLLGYYTLGHLMCQEALGFSFPMGDTGRFFHRKRLRGFPSRRSARHAEAEEKVNGKGA